VSLIIKSGVWVCSNLEEKSQQISMIKTIPYKNLFAWTLLCLSVLNCHADNTMGEIANLSLSEAEQNWLSEHKILRIAPDPDFPPMEFFDEEGRYQGFVADYMRLVAERLGVRLEVIRKDNWTQVIEALRSGEVDLIGANVPDDESRQKFLFTEPYFGYSHVIVSHEGIKGQVRLEDLAGKQVLVTAGWSEVELLRSKYPQIKVVEVESILEGLTKVALQRA
jgi:ABC-type amino acid transport substrate-binding protein